jgi:hypothetical protein
MTRFTGVLALMVCVACGGAPKQPAATPASSAVPAASEPAQNEKPAERPSSVFVVHQVPDFDAYLKQFKDNTEARAAAGVRRFIMARLADGRVALHFSAGSLKSVQDFLDHQYLTLVEADRATDSTLIWTTTDDLDELPTEVAPGSVSLFKKFLLTDTDCGVRALIKAQSALSAQGILGFSLHHSSTDADVAILHVLARDASVGQSVFVRDLPLALEACGATELQNPILADNQSEM